MSEMAKRSNLYSKLKELTGCSYEKIAKEFGVSKQHINQSFGNHSLTYENSNKFMVLRMVNLKIDEYKTEIENLKMKFLEDLKMNENVEKVVDKIIDLLQKRAENLKNRISEVCKSDDN